MDDLTVSKAVDAWAAKYERTAPQAPDYELDLLPVHPDPDQRGCIAVIHPSAKMYVFDGLNGVPRPSYTLFSAGGTIAQSVWWLQWPVTNTPDKSKQWNIWRHVGQCLSYHLSGQLAGGDQMVNPMVVSDSQPFPEEQSEYLLGVLREELKQKNLFTQVSTMPTGMASRGGSAGTEAQNDARRAALKKALAARAAKRAALAETVVPPTPEVQAKRRQAGDLADDDPVELEELVEMLSAPSPASPRRRRSRMR